MKKLSIIIPVFNEQHTIGEIITRVFATDIAPWEKQVIVVDDGSTDASRHVIEKLLFPITKIFLPHNKGKGTAIQTGMKAATGTHILIQDADLEYHPKDIAVLLRALTTKNTNVIFGSRNLSKDNQKGALIPRLGVFGLTYTVNFLFKLQLTDIWTGYKLFPRALADSFVEGGFESEIIHTLQLVEAGHTIAEVPISYVPRTKQQGKKIRYRDGIKAWFCILKIYIKGIV